MTKRVARQITDKKDIDFLLSIKEEDITFSLMMELFGEFEGKSRFHPYDTIEIPAGSFGPEGYKNQNKFVTTVGLWIWNRYHIEKELTHVFGYINYTIDKKKFGKLNVKMSYAVLEDDITIDVLKHFIMKTQADMPFVSVISPSMTEKMLTSGSVIDKKKKEIYKKYEERLKEGDEVAAEAMEKELLDFAKEYLKDDPSLDSFDSGARGSFGNNFKNMFIMKGAIKDPDPNKGYNIAMSNYMEGMSKDEYAVFANSLAAGPYARGKKTEIGGYWEKLFVAAFQHVVLDKEGSDCKTKRYVETVLTNPEDWIYSYMVQGDKLVQLNSKNMEQYRGKKVKMRFSSMCESKTGICNKCAGDLQYKLNMLNIGMATPVIPSTLKNLSMKSFHDSSVKTVEMDVMKAFGCK